MESAGARRRERLGQENDSQQLQVQAPPPPPPPPPPTRAKPNEPGRAIPKFTVDLSLPPEKRYAHIAPQFRNEVAESNLTGLFVQLVFANAGRTIGRWLVTASRYVLRHVYTREETAELRGISASTGVDMHVLVAFNVLLDLLLGCTSSGVRVHDEQSQASVSRMVHFRTLDWGMEELRKIIIELDFVHFAGGPVVATSVTYFGYVGVLTGVRPGLSMSLNFRPHHDRSSWWKRVGFRWHQVMVVLGFRQSISSAIRHILLDPWPAEPLGGKEGNRELEPAEAAAALAEGRMRRILSKLSCSQSTAAYMIFCMPQRVYVVEKDNRAASVRDSSTFLTAYNHDASDEADPSQLAATIKQLRASNDPSGLDSFVASSLDRKEHLEAIWARRSKACQRKFHSETDTITMDDVMRMVKDREIRNDETHYAVVMDPEGGKILWRRCYDPEE
ncbi:hypothetical protein GQ53DRAFT_92446 [Thozetella sp. PMI_491]|nr:hypothetical protein GQ53DRAFT_92446 [Thozetella sp. PMI_491]